MEAIICDRCKKVVGEKSAAKPFLLDVKAPWPPGTDMTHGPAAAVPPGKGQATRKLALCDDCGKMQEKFLQGDEDLRMIKCQVVPADVEAALLPFVGELLRADELGKVAEAVIARLPNGGVF